MEDVHSSFGLADRVWAKSDPVHPLWCHMLDAAAVAFELLPYFGVPRELTPEWTAALVGLHDIGKADPLFQAKAPDLASQLPPELFDGVLPEDVTGFRHEARSADLMLSNVLAKPGASRASPLAKVVARALAGHHGRVDPRRHTPSEEAYPTRRARWAPYRGLLTDLVLRGCGVGPLPGDTPHHADACGVRLLGLTIVADWIASNPALYSAPSRGASSSAEGYMRAARKNARDAVTRLGLTGLELGAPRTLPRWCESWPELAPRGIQLEVAESAGALVPGLAIIEAAMGEGKTEAAIHLAAVWSARLGLAGAYIALPTQATSNALHARYRRYLERQGSAAPLLVHGMSWLLDDAAILPPPTELDHGREREAQRREAAAWLRNLRRALLAPNAVGTIDQILFAALGVRFGVLRLLGLSNKVLIVDEVHACDTYMRVRLERVLAWCRVLGTPVILLSATLPRAHRESLVRAYLGRAGVQVPSADAYPSITTVAPDGDVNMRASGAVSAAAARRIRLVHVPADLRSQPPHELVDLVLASVASGGCAVVIVNTVTVAQRMFRALRERAEPRLPVLLFHARFPAWRREELEREIVGRFGKTAVSDFPRPQRAIVVATQVVEQSLDLDFDVMFSEVAPVDLILQRLGRLWRHEWRERVVREPVLHLVGPPDGTLAFGRSEFVYSRLHLLRTFGVLRDREEISLPSDFRPLIEFVYGDPTAPSGPIPAACIAEAAAAEREAEARDRAAAANQLIAPPDDLEFRYPEHDFVVPEAEEGELGTNLRAQTRKGAKSQGVFAITRAQERDLLALAHDASPSGALLRRLFLTRVAIPEWWVRTSALAGAPTASGHPLLDLTEGAAACGRLRFDRELGIHLEEERDDDPPSE